MLSNGSTQVSFAFERMTSSCRTCDSLRHAPNGVRITARLKNVTVQSLTVSKTHPSQVAPHSKTVPEMRASNNPGRRWIRRAKPVS